nr:hypothetical protein HmN_000422000 [Hymenolepis microstoma]
MHPTTLTRVSQQTDAADVMSFGDCVVLSGTTVQTLDSNASPSAFFLLFRPFIVLPSIFSLSLSLDLLQCSPAVLAGQFTSENLLILDASFGLMPCLCQTSSQNCQIPQQQRPQARHYPACTISKLVRRKRLLNEMHRISQHRQSHETQQNEKEENTVNYNPPMVDNDCIPSSTIISEMESNKEQFQSDDRESSTELLFIADDLNSERGGQHHCYPSKYLTQQVS